MKDIEVLMTHLSIHLSLIWRNEVSVSTSSICTYCTNGNVDACFTFLCWREASLPYCRSYFQQMQQTDYFCSRTGSMGAAMQTEAYYYWGETHYLYLRTITALEVGRRKLYMENWVDSNFERQRHIHYLHKQNRFWVYIFRYDVDGVVQYHIRISLHFL